MVVTFVVPGIAAPQGSMKPVTNKATGKTVVIGDNPKTKPWRLEVAWMARAAGCRPFAGAISVDVEVRIPRPRGHFTKSGRLKPTAPAYPETRPDGDKLLRAILDALTGVAYLDDGQVSDQTIRKRFCVGDSAPETTIRVAPMEPPPLPPMPSNLELFDRR